MQLYQKDYCINGEDCGGGDDGGINLYPISYKLFKLLVIILKQLFCIVPKRVAQRYCT
ncbi:MAG: hypothetical protein FD136_1155, partial [Chitinophagaceae bacterium]